MQYRNLGRTGLKVSQLGFGAMRLPLVDEMTRFVPGAERVVALDLAVPMMQKCFA